MYFCLTRVFIICCFFDYAIDHTISLIADHDRIRFRSNFVGILSERKKKNIDQYAISHTCMIP